METLSGSTLTICGIDELPEHGARGVSHVLSLLDPEWPEIEAFQGYGAHQRTTLRFHDIIDPQDGMVAPTRNDMAEILRFGSQVTASAGAGADAERHLLVHCHMGVSRSTAAMLGLLAQAQPQETEDRLFARLRAIRPQAWPNSRMIGFADDLLGREGRLVAALGRHYALQLEAEPRYQDWMTRLGRRQELEMAV